MSPMSRNNSAASLMGFSVHQPAIGAPLQFFPAMGSKQLDEMIDAYVPGDASILDKRAAVSMEFFEYTMATGDLFKFFMVYPTLGSTGASPSMNSGSYSSFATSPAMSEGQWSNPSPQMVSPSSSKKAASPNDFSNLPGMKIMTKDGRDVTNSASRGCKTKEQRDHAHLMRIIKACDSCRRKKTKCDPSHKRSAGGTSSGKITKKASKTSRPAAAPPQIPVEQVSVAPELDQFFSGPSIDPVFTESLNAPTDGLSMEWDQFIQYDEEPTEMIPYDYDFLLDPAGYFSPTTTASFSSSSTSPSQIPITPIDRDVNIPDGTVVGHDHKPLLPYLDPAGVEAGNNYVDFNLYSPQSSFLDEELGLATEVAASPIQSKRRDPNDQGTYAGQETVISSVADVARPDIADAEIPDWARPIIISSVAGDSLFHDSPNSMQQWLGSVGTAGQDGVFDPRCGGLSPNGQLAPIPAGLLVTSNVFEGITSEGLYGREAIYERPSSRLLSDHSRAQLSPVSSNTAGPSARLRVQQEVTHSAVEPLQIHSLSPQPSVIRSCGQDELSSAERSAIYSTTMRPHTSEGEQEVQLNRMHHGRSTAVARDNTYRDPGEAAPSSMLSSAYPTMVITNSWNTRNARPSTSELSSRPTLTTKGPVTAITAVATVQHSTTGQEPSAIPRIPSDKPQSLVPLSSGSKRRLASMNSQLVSLDRMTTISMMSRLHELPVLVASPVSLGVTIAKGNGLIEGAQSHMLGDVARCAAATLLSSTAICQPASFILLLSIMALLVIGFYIQLHRRPSRPAAQSQPCTSPPSRQLPYTKQLLIDAVDSFKVSYAKALHMVQCDITRKLKLRTHSHTTPATRLPHESLSRGIKRTALPLVRGRRIQTLV
ncbi:hypothetical protein GGR51DRAFT_184940 [Nemania sp. FL0031]|nr:hypothetical protein GGR51DRAFT_184940 [Nemania sp. FL0031]